jgi:hypothetical protein
VDAVLTQTLTTRADRALNQVSLEQARRVRFMSRGRGLGSVKNKRTNTGLRFVLQPPEQGNVGYLLGEDDWLPALIDWKDPVVTYGLAYKMKYARLIVRQDSYPHAEVSRSRGPTLLRATGAGRVPNHKPKHQIGSDSVGLDLGPSALAIVSGEGIPRPEPLCADLAPDAQAIRRL